MSARALTFTPLPPMSVRPVWIRVLRGEFRLGQRRVELTPARIFADIPPGFPRPRALALMTGDTRWVTYLSLARPLVLRRSSGEGGYTIVAGLETWCVARAVGPAAPPVVLYGCVVETTYEDTESIAALLLALSTGTTARRAHGAIARITRTQLGGILSDGQPLGAAEIADLHGVSRQALWNAERKMRSDR